MPTPARWQRTWEIFHAALERSPEEREDLLRNVCGEDAALLGEVKALLRCEGPAATFLDQPAVLYVDDQEPEPVVDLVGTQVGHYRILGILGEGGLGVVYDAAQDEPLVRRVALKLIKPGMDSREVMARFASERQTLALMRHPHIAGVYDAGTTDSGRPYFVMERVEGEPITAYCDRRRLTVRSRLLLLLDVFDAIQHAHQKGVVHRDVKPSNVLVYEEEGAAIAKVIDFGIAKAMQSPGSGSNTTLLTNEGGVVGTPEYMSPEQTRGEADLDTRTDIYALGVMLYELAVGRLPFEPARLRQASPAERERILGDEEPPCPSRRLTALTRDVALAVADRRRVSVTLLEREVRGELDWITGRAMAKERERRYASVSELGEDVRRYLDGRPVQAGPPTMSYRLRRFVGRHRLLVGVGSGALVALVAFAAAMALQTARLSSALDRAERERQRATEVSSVLVEMFEISDPEKGRGGAVTAREILDRGAERVSSGLSGQADLQGELLVTLGRVYHNLGLYDRAEELERRALRLRTETGSVNQTEIASGLVRLADTLLRLERYDEAESLLEEALGIQRRALGAMHRDVAETLDLLGELAYCRGNYAMAELRYRESLAMRSGLLGELDPLVAATRTKLARLLLDRGDSAEAERLARESLAVQRLRGPHPALAESLNTVAASLLRQGKFEQAETLLLETLELSRQLLGEEHERVADVLNNLAMARSGSGDLEGAETAYREALRVGRATLGDRHPHVAGYLQNLGVVLLRRGELAAAEPLLREAVARLEEQYGPGHPQLAYALTSLGVLLQHEGDVAGAAERYERALAIARETLGGDHPLIATISAHLDSLSQDQSDSPEAAAEVVRARQIEGVDR